MTELIRDQDWVGTVFATRYHVESRIGTGASATVYRARLLDEERPVALKISRPFVLTKAKRAARFLREVQAVHRIDHESCARILDWGVAHECAYIAMELVEGDDLYEVIHRDAPLPPAQAVGIAAAMCGVLQAAHELGVVHRDLKPRNVVLLPTPDPAGRPRVKVLDFGLAKLLRAPTDDEGTLPLELTRPGAVIGTPHYMAPEQVRVEGEIDGRADLYAVCVILYELVTGHRPLEERNAVRALIALGTTPPRPPSEHVADIDPELERVILRGLEKKPEARFASARELGEHLDAIAERLKDDELPTRLFPADDADDGVETRVVRRSADEEADRAETEVMSKRRRPRVRPIDPLSSEDSEEEPPTRVYAPGQAPRAPKMVAKAPPKAPSEPDLDEHAPTVVMKVGGSKRRRSREPRGADDHRDRVPPTQRMPSQVERGVRAAVLTLTLATLAGALGRWLACW